MHRASQWQIWTLSVLVGVSICSGKALPSTYACNQDHILTLGHPDLRADDNFSVSIEVSGEASQGVSLEPRVIHFVGNLSNAPKKVMIHLGETEGSLVLSFNLSGPSAKYFSLAFSSAELRVVCMQSSPKDRTWWAQNSAWAVPSLLATAGTIVFLTLLIWTRRLVIASRVKHIAKKSVNSLKQIYGQIQVETVEVISVDCEDVEIEIDVCLTKTATTSIDFLSNLASTPGSPRPKLQVDKDELFCNLGPSPLRRVPSESSLSNDTTRGSPRVLTTLELFPSDLHGNDDDSDDENRSLDDTEDILVVPGCVEE